MTDEIKIALKRALASERCAEYFYHYTGIVSRGLNQSEITEHFFEHEKEEREHATIIENRLQELGEKPLFTPDQWIKFADCPYPTINSTSIYTNIKLNIELEKCAIDNYMKLLELTDQVDPITNDIVIQILKDEEEHRKDLKIFQENLKPFYMLLKEKQK